MDGAPTPGTKAGKVQDDGADFRLSALAYPLLPAADLASILGVSRQAIDQYVGGLKEERKKRREEALAQLKRKEIP